MNPQNPTSSKTITILLVDDDPDCRMLVRDIIGTISSSAEVREVSSGPEALEYLRGGGASVDAPRPDLITLDLEMPGLNGQDVLRAVKSDPALREIPVVMLTGLDDDRQRRTALANGASSYLVKPADPRRFIRTVSESVARWVVPSPAGRAAYESFENE